MIRPRRSLLFMPGSNARALEKARSLPADGIILDLEDSVAPDARLWRATRSPRRSRPAGSASARC
jgi:citrate lyase beta subunit